ncbi:MAG TPA: 2,4'-dihydroxyacetophenone dioxygenase family protein [Alphaproteobacteria bacterium]|nr:2,4'-dihydroxyacetophenone dioxygenase family protein [Alphaproteobacteria bacterium]
MRRNKVEQALPYGVVKDIAVPVEPEDERYWVPDGHGLFMRPLMINPTNGDRVALVKVKRNGIVSRHRHPGPVHGYVLKGEWYYLEHDWVARPGMYVYEPPGDIHTLVVPEHVEEMVSLFHTFGAVIYLDENGKTVDYDDVHTVIEVCRKHYDKVGIGADYVDTLIR